MCLFCKRKYPSTTFKNDAHIIPELLGNKYLVSDFECDECNLKFGKYDDHLAKFLGISRTLNGVKTKGKFASFKSADERLRAGKSTFNVIPGIEISSFDDIDNPIDFDFVTGAGSVKVKKQSYRPLHVFKSFVKMALCCIKQPEISSYQLAIDYLLSERLDESLKGASRLLAYRISYPCWTSPFGILFRKKDPSKKLPTHIFVLFAHGTIYQILVPFHVDDLKFYNDSPMKLNRFPPISHHPGAADVLDFYQADFDLSSKNLVKGEEEKINFQIAESDLMRMASYNMGTKQIEKLDGFTSSIRKILLVKPGFTINPSED